MEKIKFEPDGKEAVEFYILEQTMLGGVTYLLVTEEEDGDSDAFILKDLSSREDTEGLYEIVSDERELSAVAEIFEDLLEDVTFITEEE